MIATITKDNLPEIRELLQRMVRETFPEVTFTDIWIRRSESWYGDEVVDIWSVYEGEVGQINPAVRNRLGVRIQDALWDRGITASPVTRFITKSDVGDRVPVGFDPEDLGREIATSWEWRPRDAVRGVSTPADERCSSRPVRLGSSVGFPPS